MRNAASAVLMQRLFLINPKCEKHQVRCHQWQNGGCQAPRCGLDDSKKVG